jgi:tRNA threonylcarbamoyladenosine biosynthesis protein TsaE
MQVDKKYTTTSSEETQKIGQDLAKEILSLPKSKAAKILCLKGNLGGGKTTFLQGFANGLGIKEKIFSPTFVIMKRYDNFYHIDCYRINKPDDILELDFENIIKNSENIVAIEWPEKIKNVLPKDIIKINFKFIDENQREINLKM